MDKIPKDNLLKKIEREDSQSLKKDEDSGVSKSGRDVKSTVEKKQIPVIGVDSSDKPLTQRSLATVAPKETSSKKSDVFNSVVHVKEEKTRDGQLVSQKQKEFEETLIFADLDPFLGFDEDNVNSLKTEFKNLKIAEDEIAKQQGRQLSIEVAQENKKDSVEKIVSMLNEFESGVGLHDLTSSLMQQMERNGIPQNNVSDEVFKKEFSILLDDMHSRGFGFSSKAKIMNSDETQERELGKDQLHASPNSYSSRIEGYIIKRLKRFNEVFSQLPEFDTKLEKFINSDKCFKWNVEQPLYRGGDVSLERKMLRNIKKNKLPFRKDLINRGKTVHGFGQYYTSCAEFAGEFADGNVSPVILTTMLKEGTPLINYHELMEYFEEDGWSREAGMLNWKEYLQNFCKHPLLLADSKESGNHQALVYTLPHGESINHVTMNAKGDMPDYEGPKAYTELSMHRLEEGNYILGYPEEFQTVDIPDNTKKEDTDFVALGYSSGEALAVKKCQVDTKVLYFVEAPEKKDECLLVKQIPESLLEEPIFILEPCGDFLLHRKKEKIAELQKEENRMYLERQAKENIEIVRCYFNVLSENYFGA